MRTWAFAKGRVLCRIGRTFGVADGGADGDADPFAAALREVEEHERAQRRRHGLGAPTAIAAEAEGGPRAFTPAAAADDDDTGTA